MFLGYSVRPTHLITKDLQSSSRPYSRLQQPWRSLKLPSQQQEETRRPQKLSNGFGKDSNSSRIPSHQGYSARDWRHRWTSSEPYGLEDVPTIEEQRTEVISLLRAILRECSYLPDPNARIAMKQTAMRKFHRHNHKDSPETMSEQRRAQLMNDGRKSLLKLTQANQGYYKPLLQILLLTYGRTGRRRHELLAPLKRHEVLVPLRRHDASGNNAYEDVVVRTLRASLEKDVCEQVMRHAPTLTPALEALMHSQRESQPLELTRANPKKLAPTIPKENIWHKPLSAGRVTNLVKKWYANILDKLLPPLPRAEWENLRELARGAVRWQGIVERRAVPGWVAAGHGSEGNSLKDATNPDGDRFKALEEVLVAKKLKASKGKERAHLLSPRYMRRMWGRVFSMCPVMDWDAAQGKWIVQWGCLSNKWTKPRDLKPGQSVSTNIKLVPFFVEMDYRDEVFEDEDDWLKKEKFAHDPTEAEDSGDMCDDAHDPTETEDSSDMCDDGLSEPSEKRD